MSCDTVSEGLTCQRWGGKEVGIGSPEGTGTAGGIEVDVERSGDEGPALGRFLVDEPGNPIQSPQ